MLALGEIAMSKPIYMFNVQIGFDPDRGYAAVLSDVHLGRMKGVKGNSIRQLMRRVSEEVCNEEQRKRRFPLEAETSAPLIITPGDKDFNGG